MTEVARLRIVVTGDPRLLPATKGSIEQHGGTVLVVLDTIGVITAEIPAAAFGRLSEIPGVSIEIEQRLQLQPPSSFGE